MIKLKNLLKEIEKYSKTDLASVPSEFSKNVKKIVSDTSKQVDLFDTANFDELSNIMKMFMEVYNKSTEFSGSEGRALYDIVLDASEFMKYDSKKLRSFAAANNHFFKLLSQILKKISEKYRSEDKPHPINTPSGEDTISAPFFQTPFGNIGLNEDISKITNLTGVCERFLLYTGKLAKVAANNFELPNTTNWIKENKEVVKFILSKKPKKIHN